METHNTVPVPVGLQGSSVKFGVATVTYEQVLARVSWRIKKFSHCLMHCSNIVEHRLCSYWYQYYIRAVTSNQEEF